MINKRVFKIREGEKRKGSVIYWMQRDLRAYDNWAFYYSQTKAVEMNTDLIVIFCFCPSFLEARPQHYNFLIDGLKETERDFIKFNIPFFVLYGEPFIEIPKFIEKTHAALLVKDFNPLKTIKKWEMKIASFISIPFFEVDAHNIVPCRFASDKLEYGAHTIRPKIHNLLNDFLTNIPPPEKMRSEINISSVNWDKTYNFLKINPNAKYYHIKAGEKEALVRVKHFLSKKLKAYSTTRNDPNLKGVSGLSPYFHFGQLSVQRVALLAQNYNENEDSLKIFLDELIIRRELADNYCHYNPNYDSFEGFPQWARKTLDEHKRDKRKFIYSLNKFETAETHDDLWNASQKEIIIKGGLNGYLRMYWAKKILEWTTSPEEALSFAIYLNNKYQLDGRDPNGYAGIAWSIGGVHDRAWSERDIFGKIRYMNYEGCRRKFDVEKYIKSQRP